MSQRVSRCPAGLKVAAGGRRAGEAMTELDRNERGVEKGGLEFEW